MSGRPFTSADHFLNWQNRNCCRCTKYELDQDKPVECNVQYAVETCALNPDNGMAALAIVGRRADGFIANDCPLIELTAYAKRENSAAKTLPLFKAGD